jgi:hypothetical protein
MRDLTKGERTMKRLVAGVTMAVLVGGVATLAMAQPGWGPMMGGGPGMMRGGGPGMMGGGPGGRMGWAGGGPGCAGVAGAQAQAQAPTVDEEKATALATEYATKYYKGYAVERVVPFQGRFHTAYQAELKNQAGDTRVLHVNPWGGVRPGPTFTR